MAELKFLIENTKVSGSKLETEHGLSIHVETQNLNFIFDCGHTGLAWKNAELLNVNLAEIQFAVLSHSHYDHAGGFPSLLKYANPKVIYTGTNFWQEKYSYNMETNEFKYKGCGFTWRDLQNWRIRQEICNDMLEIDGNTWLIGNFKRRYEFETIPEKFKRGVNKQADDFSDEICLVIREEDGAAIITGCAHNGILNIITTVNERLNLPIYSVIGGIHLKGADSNRIDQTLTEMENLGITKLYICHCSGEEVQRKLGVTKLAGYKISTGSKLIIPA